MELNLQSPFKELKRINCKQTSLAHPNFNIPSDVQTDASDCQLSAVVSQNNCSIAFFMQKLTDTQKNCAAAKKESLSTAETLKEFCTILLGHKINVFADHKNPVYETHNCKNVMWWQSLLEDYGPNFACIPERKMLLLMLSADLAL